MKIHELLDIISGIADDSREVAEGYLFFAIPGTKQNGENYIEHAVKQGAKFIVLDRKSKVATRYKGIKYIEVDNPRAYLSKISSLFYQKQPNNIVAITGTNGKTSVANFFQQICALLGYKSASIGTLGIMTSEKSYKSKDIPSLTSPTPIELHKILKELSDNSYTHVAIEASSHGIYQNRLDNVKFKATGFTNLSQDHLDYHSTLQTYFQAKLRLFSEILEVGSYAVLNADIKEFEAIKQVCQECFIKVIEYGKKAKDLQIESASFNHWKMKIFDQEYVLQSPLRGEFQLYNLLCSIGLAVACGLPVYKIIGILDKITAVKGRLELVAKYNGADVYIDYAHTPDSLKTVLLTLREICEGNLHVLFGCGGERDIEKRYMMGDIANKYADYIIVTDDNPRGEDSAIIRRQIMKACPNGAEIEGRGKAIEYAIKSLKVDDILVIAGKGHENYQLIANNKIYFSDFDEVQKLISNTKNNLSQDKGVIP